MRNWVLFACGSCLVAAAAAGSSREQSVELGNPPRVSIAEVAALGSDTSNVDEVDVSGDLVTLGDCEDDEMGIDAGAVLVYTPDASGDWVRETKLFASDASAGEQFGVNQAVDGAYLVANTGSRSAVYVFERDAGGSWQEVQRIAGVAGEDFGRDLDIDGDTIAVAAPKADGDSGVVYVYRREASGVWTQEDRVEQPAQGRFVQFGEPLSLDDGLLTVLNFGPNVFERDPAGSWNPSQYLGPENNFQERYVDIAIDGGRIAVANDAFIGFSGTIRIYEPNPSGQYVEVADVWPKANGFGSDADISGDLIASAFSQPQDGGGGSILVWWRNQADQWNNFIELVPSGSTRNDSFGARLAIDDKRIIGWALKSEDSDDNIAYVFEFTELSD